MDELLKRRVAAAAIGCVLGFATIGAYLAIIAAQGGAIEPRVTFVAVFLVGALIAAAVGTAGLVTGRVATQPALYAATVAYLVLGILALMSIGLLLVVTGGLLLLAAGPPRVNRGVAGLAALAPVVLLAIGVALT